MMRFFQAKHVLVKMNSLFQVGYPVTSVKELFNHRRRLPQVGHCGYCQLLEIRGGLFFITSR
jgi:hypothetical protein